MNRPASKYRPRACNECGEAYTPRRCDEYFCSTPCRKDFENRAMVRGRDLYTLFMVMRYERGLARLRGVWGVACALARRWREEDERERAGRKSWYSYDKVMDRLAESGRLPLGNLPGVTVIQGHTGLSSGKRIRG
jgi:hypothetical protein